MQWEFFLITVSLNRNTIDAVGIFSDDWKLAQEQDDFKKKKKKHIQICPKHEENKNNNICVGNKYAGDF